jgi:hypothetical protein
MPLAPAYDWVEMFVAFDDFMDAAAPSPRMWRTRTAS